ncbi:Transmembrane protein [Lasiodiplodia hormozganensis]|uniref:Transmembrane protein n=2 Tax=Lasiodiplodia TaxID=66739 RepID=A0A5N5DBT7_9PEZI|nr:Transmembrane protein [Lasiodiplodia theobromae]KAK0653728.1 Transmembrane protein [Lasiodiplodia hormozganensis]
MLPPSNDRRSRLPPWISRWLGYRASSPAPLPWYLTYLWSFVAAFCGLSVLQAIFNYSNYFKARHVPGIIASYGASAVLVYGVPQAPLSQPRALIGGHFLSALVGICVTKLFSLMPSDSKFESLRWLAASLSTAIAIVVMQITETTHPPAGATALLPAVDEDIWNLSWYYLPIVLLSSTMILLVGIVINNTQRVYPVFWFAPAKPAKVEQGPESKG